MEPKPPVLKDGDRDWVWTIHKEADTLLHARIQGFLTLQAIFLASHFTIIALVKDSYLKVAYALIIICAGVVCSVAFFFMNRRIIKGIIRLKKEYLLKDEFYMFFYMGDNPKYNFAKGVP